MVYYIFGLIVFCVIGVFGIRAAKATQFYNEAQRPRTVITDNGAVLKYSKTGDIMSITAPDHQSVSKALEGYQLAGSTTIPKVNRSINVKGIGKMADDGTVVAGVRGRTGHASDDGTVVAGVRGRTPSLKKMPAVPRANQSDGTVVAGVRGIDPKK